MFCNGAGFQSFGVIAQATTMDAMGHLDLTFPICGGSSVPGAMPQVLVQRPRVALSDDAMRHASGASGPLWTKVKGEPYSTQIMIDEW